MADNLEATFQNTSFGSGELLQPENFTSPNIIDAENFMEIWSERGTPYQPPAINPGIDPSMHLGAVRFPHEDETHRYQNQRYTFDFHQRRMNEYFGPSLHILKEVIAGFRVMNGIEVGPLTRGEVYEVAMAVHALPRFLFWDSISRYRNGSIPDEAMFASAMVAGMQKFFRYQNGGYEEGDSLKDLFLDERLFDPEDAIEYTLGSRVLDTPGSEFSCPASANMIKAMMRAFALHEQEAERKPKHAVVGYNIARLLQYSRAVLFHRDVITAMMIQVGSKVDEVEKLRAAGLEVPEEKDLEIFGMYGDMLLSLNQANRGFLESVHREVPEQHLTFDDIRTGADRYNYA